MFEFDWVHWTGVFIFLFFMFMVWASQKRKMGLFKRTSTSLSRPSTRSAMMKMKNENCSSFKFSFSFHPPGFRTPTTCVKAEYCSPTVNSRQSRVMRMSASANADWLVGRERGRRRGGGLMSRLKFNCGRNPVEIVVQTWYLLMVAYLLYWRGKSKEGKGMILSWTFS